MVAEVEEEEVIWALAAVEGEVLAVALMVTVCHLSTMMQGLRMGEHIATMMSGLSRATRSKDLIIGHSKFTALRSWSLLLLLLLGCGKGTDRTSRAGDSSKLRDRS